MQVLPSPKFCVFQDKCLMFWSNDECRVEKLIDNEAEVTFLCIFFTASLSSLSPSCGFWGCLSYYSICSCYPFVFYVL